MTNIELSIQGMSCGHCAKAVQTALAAVPGIVTSSVVVGSAKIAFDPAVVTAQAIAAAIEAEGYQVAAS